MHVLNYFEEVSRISKMLDYEIIENLAQELIKLRERKGRLFILGVGGSAANCSHAVNDFRKLCEIEAYAPTDNVSELTARTNDDGWESVFSSWLRVSGACKSDAVLVFSVGGGDINNNISPNIVSGLKYAKEHGLKIFGVVGEIGGYTKEIGDYVVCIPTLNSSRITPHAEAFQGVVWHCLVSHPGLQMIPTKW